MKYIDEYRDESLTRGLLAGIRRLARDMGRDITIMEVCGSHTTAMGRYGIRGLMPENIRLVSGPGCPVCVTAIEDVDRALQIAATHGVIFATFGDMLRVPGSNRTSLQDLRAQGADIRVVISPAECLGLALSHADRQIVFMGIGFETTSPAIASVTRSLKRNQVKNASIFSVHKVMPPAIKTLLDDPGLKIDGFLCPGHVSTMIGSHAYEPIVRSGCAAVITGFEPLDILEGIYMIMRQIRTRALRVEIQYTRAVKPEGNIRAMAILDEVFRRIPSRWRGLGLIPGSGLALKEDYASFDALRRFDLPDIASEEITGCRCGDILRGAITPRQCPLFGEACTPVNPLGPCMVSTEGTCASYYNYH